MPRQVQRQLLPLLDDMQQDNEDGRENKRQQCRIEGHTEVRGQGLHPRFEGPGIGHVGNVARRIEGHGDADHRADKTEGRNQPHQVPQHVVFEIDLVLVQLQARIDQAVGLID